MKKTLFLILALLLAVVQGAWAQTEVGTEQALKEAVSNNQSVKMTADIALGSRLVIESGKNVTLDLNGHQLSRSLGGAADDGNVVRVEKLGTLTVKDGSGTGSGTITGGKAINGGGICNHGTLTFEGGTITGCYASSNGGGIYNAPVAVGSTPATLSVKGGRITGNTCSDRGAGIFNYSDCTLNMEGDVYVWDNKKGEDRNNVYLDGETFITVTGTLQKGFSSAEIGVSISENPRAVTKDFRKYNPAAADGIFIHSDDGNKVSKVLDGEVKIGVIANYNERSWDEKTQRLNSKKVTKMGILLSGSHPDDWKQLGDGGQEDHYYVVKGNVSYKTLNVFGKVHLILTDDATLTLTGGLKVEEDNNATIIIYSESDGDHEGRLVVTNSYDDAAGIGSSTRHNSGTITIHGGKLNITGGKNGAGIGAGYYPNGDDAETFPKGPITIYGGTVTTNGGEKGAGIGGGYHKNAIIGSPNGGTYIYGGTVNATGGEKGSGIGGGGNGRGIDVFIMGGTVNAKGGTYAAGIGGGENNGGGGGTINIFGGNVTAKGGKEGAGIGGGDNGRGGKLYVSGGNVRAEGSGGGAGIGGGDRSWSKAGQQGKGAEVVITGGTVVAIAGEKCKCREDDKGSAIGAGHGYSDKYSGADILKIPDNYMVTVGDAENNIECVSIAGIRIWICRWRNYVKLEPCTHTAPTVGNDHTEAISYAARDSVNHSFKCRYCGYKGTRPHDFGEDNTKTCICGQTYGDVHKTVYLSDTESNHELLIKFDNSTKDVCLINRVLYKGGRWNTLYLPFDVDNLSKSPLAGAIVKQLSSSSFADSTVTMNFTDATSIKAGRPYLVKWNAEERDTVSPVFRNVTIRNVYNDVETEYVNFVGIYSPLSPTFTNFIYLNEDDQELHYYTDDLVLLPFRASFQILNIMDNNHPVPPHRVVMNFGDSKTLFIVFELGPSYTWEGDGTEASPYIISSREQLYEMQEAMNGTEGAELEGKYFRQGANITLDKTVSNNFTPVKTFKGHYDGAGYTISGLNIDLSKDNLSRAALFGTLEGSATVKNVIVQNSTIIGASAAAVAGYVSGTSRVENCHALKDVVIDAAYWYAGGIVAYTNDGTPTIASCTSQASVHTFDNYAGGVIGRHDNGSATGCIYLGNSITHTKGTSYAHAVIGGGGHWPTDCYFTDPTLTDNQAKLMPDKTVDNTDFLTRLAARDKFLTGTSGLTAEQIGYDITLNNRTTLAAVQNADGTWQSKAFSVCLPFDVNFRQQFGDDASAITDHVQAYRPHRIDLDKKELIFTGVFPEIKAGEAYVIVVKKGSVSLTGKNVTVVATPAEADKVMSAADTEKQIGEWKGTFKSMDSKETMDGKFYIQQKNGTYRCLLKEYADWKSAPFIGCFIPLEALANDRYTIRYVPTSQGDGDEEGDVTAFPTDLYDNDNEFGDGETGIGTVIANGDGTDRYYDLQGRKLSVKPAQKGVYIRDGKKIVVK